MNNYKMYGVVLALTILTLGFTGCKKEDAQKTYDSPVWTETAGTYSGSMTTVIVLPVNLEPYQSSSDEMASFVGETCRGSASQVDGKFFLTIKGTSDEQSQVTIKYYSFRNKYIYQSEQTISYCSPIKVKLKPKSRFDTCMYDCFYSKIIRSNVVQKITYFSAIDSEKTTLSHKITLFHYN